MTVQPTDIAIFLVSFAACIYCIVLSRRLKALQNTRDGLGATIMALSKSISAMSSATQDTKAQAGEMATRLSSLMEESEAMCKRMSELNEKLETAHAKASQDASAAQNELKSGMSDLLTESRESMNEMRTLLKQMRSLTGVAATTIHNSDFLFDEDEPELMERTL